MIDYDSFEVIDPKTSSSFSLPPQHQAPSFIPLVIVPGAPLGPRYPNLHRNIHKRPSQLPHYHPAPAIPNSHPTIAKASTHIQRPKTFVAKIDKAKKDLIITAEGIIRNAVYVTERYLPNRETYQTYSYDFSKENGYDFVKAVEEMSEDLKEVVLGKMVVEIVVDIEPPTVDKGKQKMIESKEGVMCASVVYSSNPVAHHSRHKAVDLSHGKDDLAITTAEPNTSQSTVLDQLFKLGTAIPPLIRKLQLTLSFPSLSNPPSTLGPSAVSLQSQSLTSSHLHNTPSWILLNSIADALEAFTSLTSLNINLLVPSNTRTSLSMEQIYHLLPFYDLSFTDWEMTYQPKGLSFQHPVRGWCVKQLDRERDRLVRERREKSLETERSIPRYLRRQVRLEEVSVEAKGRA